jgi:hypothetical protein
MTNANARIGSVDVFRGARRLCSRKVYAWHGTLSFYIGNHGKSWLNSRFLLKGPKDADSIIATKYTACHHGKGGDMEYWQDVPKAQDMCCTPSYMHKEEIRHISCASGTCAGDCSSQFHEVSIFYF